MGDHTIGNLQYTSNRKSLTAIYNAHTRSPFHQTVSLTIAFVHAHKLHHDIYSKDRTRYNKQILSLQCLFLYDNEHILFDYQRFVLLHLS